MAKLLYQRRIFNKKLSIVRLELLKSIRRVSLAKIKLRKNSSNILVPEDSGANNFIEQLEKIENLNDLNPSNPNHFIFPDEVPMYRRVNELNVWQGCCPKTLDCVEDYKKSVRLGRANLVSLMSGAMALLEEKPPRLVAKQLRCISSTAEKLASNTLNDFDKLCNNYVEGDVTCEELAAEWDKIQQRLNEVYFKFDTIDLQSK
ncbi:hypothetical protein LOD99_4953 [Oopsacas minuta]|uniref:Uncharacterized protein n=1 Tax=Oopsacas minuta TaxID=111878 RepID=A0AAV7JSH9_9METZ|nr:hypothetical protein LOD99_4953 [Oopsacas minuta]